MEFRVLQYFLAVIREQSISRAAEALHLSQPTLSRQLRDMEEELGKPLFIRSNRKITLTEEGILLRKRAEDIVSLVEKTERDISSDSREISGEIVLGGNPTHTLLAAASALQKQYPDIRFYFYSADATDITERLDHGSLDFSVLLQPPHTSRYESLALPDTSAWGVLMPRKDAFARLPVIRREELLQMPLEIHYHLVWKRDSVFGKAAGLFLEEVRRRAEVAAASAPRNVPAS